MSEIGLAEAIRALRAELAEAVSGAEGKDVRFRVGQVDLEFQVAIADQVEGNAGVKFWVVNAGVKSSDTNSTTHTVKVQLHAEMADGSEVWTGDRTGEFPR